MPTYTYECFTCKHRFEEQRNIVKRDEPGQCSRCGSHHTRLVPSVSQFTVKGYNAKNGYSK